ncbi:sigma-70 family RNA polymerase sigma factor [Mycolicibacterium vanbaalenii]|uniref:sigma-70 family RNA polymerase sigma factor n=1 Tax=Mycolicibacterium vanbaalenii TaxID=110539 RepID=UPI0023BA7FBA|nr:sigma-70 family RNA polymerase sigma factor [Mycolicibacterium vanbaalenii]
MTLDSFAQSAVHSAFLEGRPRLLSLAHRLLGSAHDAEDAVQTAWLRVAATPGPRDIANPSAWLTTVVTRVCLDQLRDRSRRDVLSRRVQPVQTVAYAADEEFLHREDVARALMVLLGRLTPAQRAAYVLHDLFAVPFDRVADILGVTPAGAKKHASRARARLRPVEPPSTGAPGDAVDREVVDAFLRAAGGGDIVRMVALMAPDAVRIVDPELLPTGTAAVVTGATAIAEETRHFADRIRASVRMRVNGRQAHIIAPGGHPLGIIDIRCSGGLITGITITPVRAADVLEPAAQPA